MSIPLTGSLTRSGGLFSAIAKNVRTLDLKAAKRISASFDPFTENVKATRAALFSLSTPTVVDTNPLCVVRTTIASDRSDAFILVDLIPEVHEQAGFNSIKINTKNLTTLEILELLNKHVTPLAPKEEEVESATAKLSGPTTTKKKKK